MLPVGHAPRAQRGRGAFQEIDQAGAARPVVKAAWVAESAEGLGNDIARAFALATSGRPGPVHLSLPGDLLETKLPDTVEAPPPTRLEPMRLPDAVVRAVWRFAGDPEAAFNLVLAGEADVMEAVAGRGRARQAEADSTLRLERYPSAVYGFLAFNLRGPDGGPHPALADRRVRLALVHAVNRRTVAQAVFG